MNCVATADECGSDHGRTLGAGEHVVQPSVHDRYDDCKVASLSAVHIDMKVYSFL